MTMKITIEELIGSDEPVKPSEENIEFKEQLEKEVEKYRKDKTVPTNEERREVARNLREPFDVVGQGRYVALNGTLFGMQLLANDEQTLRNGVKHIADLIEPESERTCHAVFDDSNWYKWICSECGQPIDRADNYCFSCGAKVVE